MARAGDSHRDRAVGVLARAYSDGKLDLHEFESRTANALKARTTWELRMLLRGLFVDDLQQRARRGLHIVAALLVWTIASLFLLCSFVVALVVTHAAAWTAMFPLCWLLVSALAVRDVRRR